MIEFTFAGFIGYTFFIVITTCVLTLLFPKTESKKNKSESKDEKFKVGGVYGHNGCDEDLNDPFPHKPYYDMYIVVLDIKPSVDGSTKYLQYVFLNNEAMPHKSYDETSIYSDTIDNWNEWEHIKDIDLDSIVIKR